MKKIKRIIVGIDIFAKSSSVLRRAFMVAEDNEAELFIVNAVQTPWLSIPSYFSHKDITVDTKGIKKKITKKIRALNMKNKVSYSIFVKEGDADDVILYKAKLFKADMIIIGANTKSKNNILGTTAEKIANRSHLPVLVVKNRVKASYKSAIAPTDFQSQSKQSVLFAKDIFPAIKIQAVYSSETIYSEGPYTIVDENFVHFNEAAKACTQKDLKTFMKDLSIKKGKIIDGAHNSKQTLVKYINKGSYDLVVVGSRGTSGFKALIGSVSSYVLREVSMDVLLYVPVD